MKVDGVLAAVDATKAKEISEKFGVKGFPTGMFCEHLIIFGKFKYYFRGNKKLFADLSHFIHTTGT